MVFEGERFSRAYMNGRIYREFQMNKNKIEMCEFEKHLENFFVSALTW